MGFSSSNKIGEGGFGSVYKDATWVGVDSVVGLNPMQGRLQDGRLVAVKVLSGESKQGDREFISEIASMANVRHENLVKVHGGCIDGGCRMLVYEYMENNNLAQTLLGEEKNREKFSWKARVEVAIGIARALAFIHEEVKPHIVHRDIKATNILLDGNFCPKVSDFGLSKLFPDNVTHLSTRVAGTLGYLAPEYAISGHLTRKSDVYSFGVLLLEIVSGRSAIDFDLELGEHFLVEKAWVMYKADGLLQLVDPLLNNSFSQREALTFLKVGLSCVQETCRLRPHMSTAVRMMRDEIDTDGLDISRPGLITSITDVKIGGGRSSQSSRSHTPSPRFYWFGL
ncbi:Serine-threonine/tyrosine-protein kinase, catalytic domain [Dillenia turbinata]|uniref:Serine-threonine/tyrosine-protein kinase, catalytic domain n=1 Tax=Dillenia turbinata TaxID=194707 RepID=A0AAN8Z8Z9_9MAGN